MKARKDYMFYEITATSEVQELNLPTRGQGHTIQIRNRGDNEVQIVLRTPTNQANFNSDNKIIKLGAGEDFEDDMLVEKIYYKATSGTSNIVVYVSWTDFY